MTKDQLSGAIAAKAGCSKKEANDFINAFGEVVVEEVRDNGETIQIPGLGIFKQRVTEAHAGRNPATGETLNIPKSVTVKLQVSPAVKKVVTKSKK